LRDVLVLPGCRWWISTSRTCTRASLSAITASSPTSRWAR
jgi:hypothetical protein